ncbi:MAG: ribosome biogenesis GTP-binding protein YihA/YsxC [Rhodospirillaceae bacterium]|nr:ribosome biogenesis GTP-binding protein YihA/YsxC [Rhodospirillaceae bacterium]MDD9999864.1 ribosome biogenesis GTP-binding protein YihA/YsxC [Rhodospirillaceae bacterium]MDE0362941.1 ribosome biogenesis GTP-binding protein YihA/YsxC [Rhodospirillaceae bacterium]
MSAALNASFLTSAGDPTQFPADSGREVAVAGRSNSGKSTAINALVGRRGLARTGKTPGRTQLINFFGVGEDRRLVDLPGYGYAKVPDSVRQHWRRLLESYFHRRRSLVGLLVTVDIRRGLKELDWVMLDWALNSDVSAAVLLTKADKLSRGASRSRHLEVSGKLPDSVQALTFSAPKRLGVVEAQQRLTGWLWNNSSA